jgi:hypothetical protein
MTDTPEPPASSRRHVLLGAGGIFGSLNLLGSVSGTTTLAPRARIDYIPEEPLTGERVRFTGLESENPGGKIVQYSWEIETPDGTREIENSTTFEQTWDISGNYDVTLTIWGGEGRTDSTTETIEIKSRAPTADFVFDPSNPKPLEEVVLNARASDPDNNIEDYEWVVEKDGTTTSTENGSEITQVWEDEGMFEATLTVTDADGNSDSETKSIEVENKPPSAVITADSYEIKTGVFVQLDGLESEDPDGTIDAYSWTVPDEDGITDTYSGDTVSVNWVSPGTYTVRLSVTDNLGKEASTDTEITVLNRAPIAEFEIVTSNPTQYQPVIFDASGSRDAESTTIGYDWTVETAAGEQSYTGRQIEHSFETAGDHEITLVVEDEQDESSSTTKTITVAPGEQPSTTTALTPDPTTQSPTTATTIATTAVGEGDGSRESPLATTKSLSTTQNGSAAAGRVDRNGDSFLTKVIGAAGIGVVGLYGLHRVVTGSSDSSSDGSPESSVSGSDPSTGSSGTGATEWTSSEALELKTEGDDLYSSAGEASLLDTESVRDKLVDARETFVEAKNAYESLDREDKVGAIEDKLDNIDSKLSALSDIDYALEPFDEYLSKTADVTDLNAEKTKSATTALTSAITVAEKNDFEADDLKTRREALKTEGVTPHSENPTRAELIDEIDQIARDLGHIPTSDEAVRESDYEKQQFDEIFEDWERTLLATEVVTERRKQAQKLFDEAEEALQNESFERASTQLKELQTQITEAGTHAPLGITANDLDILEERLREKVADRTAELVETANAKLAEAQQYRDKGKYEKAKQIIQNGIDASQEASTLAGTYGGGTETLSNDVEEQLQTAETQISVIQRLSDAARENRNSARRAISSRNYETATDELHSLRANLDELRTLEGTQQAVASFEEDVSKLESRLNQKQAESQFNGLLGSITSSISAAEERIEKGSYDLAARRLNSAEESLEDAIALNEEHNLARGESLAEREAAITALSETVNHRPTEDAVSTIEQAEQEIKTGIERREADETAEAVEHFKSAYSKYEAALELATEHDLPQEWEIRQRLSMVEEYLSVAQDTLEERQAKIRQDLEEHLSDTDRTLQTVKQYLEVEDSVAARESMQEALGQLDETKRLLETGLATESLQNEYQELETEAETLQQRVPAATGTTSHRTEDLVESLQELATKLEESPRPEFVNAYGEFPAEAYLEAFGSWPEALAAANLEPIEDESRSNRKYSRVEVLDAVVDLTEELGHPPSKGEMNKHGSMSASPVMSRFADWETALEIAGVETYTTSLDHTLPEEIDDSLEIESEGKILHEIEQELEEIDPTNESD